MARTQSDDMKEYSGHISTCAWRINEADQSWTEREMHMSVSRTKKRSTAVYDVTYDTTRYANA